MPVGKSSPIFYARPTAKKKPDAAAEARGVHAALVSYSEAAVKRDESHASQTVTRPSSLVDTRVICCGDNLEQLNKLPDACSDLIYIDRGEGQDAPQIDFLYSTRTGILRFRFGCEIGSGINKRQRNKSQTVIHLPFIPLPLPVS